MKIRILLGLLASLVGRLCFAQCVGPTCPPVTTPPAFSAPAINPEAQDTYTKIKNASVKVYAVEGALAGRTIFSRGSGTIVKYRDHVIVITAGHVISSTNVYIEHAQLGRIPCHVWSTNRRTDFAILEPTAKQEELYEYGVPILLDRVLQINETVLLAGFDAVPDLSIWRSQVKYWRSSQASKHADWMELAGRARQGDSGGGIFTTQGELAGIIWGTRVVETSDIAHFTILFFTEDGKYVDRVGNVQYMRLVPSGGAILGGSVFATWIQPVHEELIKICFRFRWRRPNRQPLPPPIESVPPKEVPAPKVIPEKPLPEPKSPPSVEAPTPKTPPEGPTQVSRWKAWFEFFKPTLWVVLSFIIYWSTLIVVDLVVLVRRILAT